MKATKIEGQTVNGQRTVLAEVLPLDTPYSITIFPIYACNFKCNYCLQSLSKDKRGHISDVISMDFELYKKCIDDIACFPHKLKTLHFIGNGEPLLHKDIAKMVAYAVDKEVANVVDIVTNGALLTPKISMELINAGLSTLRISTQGVNAKKYKQVSDVKINFDEFVENIKYFYIHRGNTNLHIKIIDSALDEQEKQTFFEIFGDICDTIAIEHLIPVIETKDNITNDFNSTILGNELVKSDICPQPFYFMQINPDGKCGPCCSANFPTNIGDSNKQSITQIWNSKEYNAFRKVQLNKKKSNNSICVNCELCKYTMFPEEILDNDAERLLKLF